MIFIRHFHGIKGLLAKLRGMPFMRALLMIVMLATPLSMGDAWATAFLQPTQAHCAMMDTADGDARHPASVHPATKVMNCAMTCAFIMSFGPLPDAPRYVYGEEQPTDLIAPLAGIRHHLDLPPPKG